MKISILGWYGHGNVGDEAFKVAFPILLGDHQFSFSDSLEPGDDSDAVILGGGDVAYPTFTQYLANARPDALKVAASVTFTDKSDFDAIARLDGIFVRDHGSLAIVNAELPGVKKVSYLPDVTFGLTPDRVAGDALVSKIFATEGRYRKTKLVVVVVSNYLAYSQLAFLARDFTTFIKLSQDLAAVADETNASFLFLPFCTVMPQDDRMTNSWVAGRCMDYNKNVVVHDRLGIQDTLNIIATADVVVSSRLHSTIFATLCGVPFIDLTHHTKNLGFIELVGKTDWSIPFWEFSIRRYKDLLQSFIDDGRAKGESLLEFARTSKVQLENATILRR